MAHLTPQELKGEERFFSIPAINLHFNKKGAFYNGGVTAFAAIIGKLTNLWVFLGLFLILNIIAYPLAHIPIPKKKFEGGGVGLDIYLLRKYKYKRNSKKIYIRRRGY
ncbi:hypothetical protein [Senegalia massiliensis]|uniref:Uncharacterized protein n=1 Tax=Senegalia massiliensis TaxID=1720316 RepID=A0A845QZK3_9CLOT|nr:hypothetical protein [Senegalia massiliensis]NBI07600.1 hypothetical protein [Senegalia massiliensis]